MGHLALGEEVTGVDHVHGFGLSLLDKPGPRIYGQDVADPEAEALKAAMCFWVSFGPPGGRLLPNTYHILRSTHWKNVDDDTNPYAISYVSVAMAMIATIKDAFFHQQRVNYAAIGKKLTYTTVDGANFPRVIETVYDALGHAAVSL